MFVCPVCVSVLLSHTVLSNLYREKLVTEDDVKRMKGEGGPPEVVARTVAVLNRYGHKEAASLLRGW